MALDETSIYKMIGTNHENGVTFNDFMREHKKQLGDRKSVLAAIESLRYERKVFSEEPWEGPGYLKRVNLYANLDTVSVLAR